MSDYLRFWQVDQSIFLRELPDGEMFRTQSLSQGIPRLLHFAKESFPSVILVVGRAGSGKTCFQKWLLDNLSADTHDLWYVPVLSREIQKGWLISRIAHYLGVVAKGLGLQQDVLVKVAGKLDQLVQEKRRLLVLVDDAQWVDTEEALSDFSALLSLQSMGARCLSFVIAGDQSLADKLRNHPSILSKVVMRLEMNPFDRNETNAYIHYRCQLAGSPNMFSPEASDKIFEKTQGVPGMINILAENCLFEAFQTNCREIDGSLVLTALAHVSFPGALSERDDDRGEAREIQPSRVLIPLATPGLQEVLVMRPTKGDKPFITPISSPITPITPTPPPSTLSRQGSKPGDDQFKEENGSRDLKQDKPISLTSLFKSDPKPGKT